MVHAVQHDVARRPAERLPLSDRLLVDLTVHHYHHQTRYPKGDARADHSVWPVHHERANLQRQGYATTSCASVSAIYLPIDTRFTKGCFKIVILRVKTPEASMTYKDPKMKYPSRVFQYCYVYTYVAICAKCLFKFFITQKLYMFCFKERRLCCCWKLTRK